ncbi:MAG: outer membrane lipoprotein chaperone LolA [Gammaproteobacteria bacterium]
MRKLFLSIIILFISFNVYAQDIKSYFSGWTGIKANFEQRVYDADNILQELSQGVLSIGMPSKFKLKYTKPYDQVYLADGKKLWFYDKDLEQVTVSKQQNRLSHTPAMILSNPQQLDKYYHITTLSESDNIAAFDLKPKDNNSQFENIRIGFIDGKLKHMEIRDSFSRITFLEFSNMKKNPVFPKDEFIFNPPKGVDVIQQQ